MLLRKENRPLVCVFDSGIGGLNLLYECVKSIPQADLAYFADNYHVPYGNMDDEQLLARTEKIFDKIARLNPAAAVVACNTVTAKCIAELRARYTFNIIGIQPAVKPAAAQGECIVLATAATANSASVRALVEKYGRGRTRVFSCPQLAAYVEQNIFSLSESEIISMLPQVEAREVVLGCTHYSFIKKTIAAYYNCRIWDGVVGTVNHLNDCLGKLNHFQTTFNQIAFLGGNISKNRQILSIMLKNGADSFLTK